MIRFTARKRQNVRSSVRFRVGAPGNGASIEIGPGLTPKEPATRLGEQVERVLLRARSPFHEDAMLVWTDLETTGLDPTKCQVIEVAAIVTDDRLNEVARFHRVAHFEHAGHIVNTLAGMRELGLGSEERETWLKRLSHKTGVDPYVLNMHDTNGLWKDSYRSAYDLHWIDEHFAKFIRGSAQTAERAEDGTAKIVKPQLAGSTISFDRSFIARDLPLALDELHYRNVDVSTLNELARRFWPEIYTARPNNETKAHRGMADIEESIRVCKHYITAFGGTL